EMEGNLAAFAKRTGIAVRYDCRWESTRLEEDGQGRRFVLTTSDGEFRAPVVVFAVGAAQPWSPGTSGMPLAYHYAETRSAETYADRRIFLIVKQVSALERAAGLLPRAWQSRRAAPSPSPLSLATESLARTRAR